MKNRENKGGGLGNSSSEKTGRDDTPSYIYKIARNSLRPDPRPSLDNAPIFEMPKSLRIWRKVKWPLFFTVVIIILLTVAGITRSVVVAKNIANTIKKAHAAEVDGTIEAMQVAEDILIHLVEKQSGNEEAQAALAWQVLVQAVLWGSEDWSEKAAEAVEAIDSEEGELAYAARSAWAYLKGDPKQALALASDGIAKHKESNRLRMMRVLSLNALGRTEEARELYVIALDAGVDYVPFIMAAMMVELEDGNRLAALELATMLLKRSPANLYATLVTIRVELPNWSEPDPDVKDIVDLQQRLDALSPRLTDAPPKLSKMGFYLKGRISLLTGDLAAAVKSFGQNPAGLSPDTLAWYGTAIRKKDGCEKTLSFLNDHSKIKGEEVLDLRAQCLLEYHRVNLAKDVIDKLAETGKLPHRVRTLRWLHAVRSGNLSQTKARIPKKITARDGLIAVETYFLLKREGDADGIKQLTKAMAEALPACTKSIRIWHAKNLKRAFRIWHRQEPEEVCDCALMAHLMRSHADPASVKAAADRVNAAADGGVSFEVDRALAVWRVEGHEKALAILDRLASRRLQGGPIRAELAQAYLEMERPDKALEVLERSEEPNLFALRILASREARKKGAADRLERRAVNRSQKSSHPALDYFYLKSRLKAGDGATVTAWMEDHLQPDALPGEWTSELVQLGAQALNLAEERVEAESFIQKYARKVITFAGSDESLETWKGQIRLNFKRVGKYRNRALTVARLLTSDGIRDPELLYWVASESIQGGSERVGFKILRDILELDPAFKPAWEKMVEMDWLNEERIAQVKQIWPKLSLTPPE